jgi:hypothetical protein
MKLRLVLTAAAAPLALLVGCATPAPDNLEHGPHNTVAYDVAIDATPPGARIEANGQIIGQTPLHLKIFGDKDGTFHDFGSYYYIVRALPLETNQFPQTRVFQTGRYFTPEDHIPQQVFFDMNQPPPAPSQAPPAVAGYPAYPYPPATYPYYYPAPYYGPTVRFYFGGPGYYHHHW